MVGIGCNVCSPEKRNLSASVPAGLSVESSIRRQHADQSGVATSKQRAPLLRGGSRGGSGAGEGGQLLIAMQS